MAITQLQLLLLIALQHFHSNFNGLIGPTGVLVSLDVGLVQLVHAPDHVRMGTNFVLAKRKKSKPVLTCRLATLTSMNVLQILKDRVQWTMDAITVCVFIF